MSDLFHQLQSALQAIADAAIEDNRRLRPREAGLAMEQEIAELQTERQSIIERLTAAEASRQRADRAVREAYEAQRVEVGARVRSDALLRAEGPLIPALLERAGDVLRPLCEALERENTQLSVIRQALDACDAQLARLEARPEVRAIRRHEENQYKIKLAEIQGNFGQPRWTQAPTVSLAPVRDLLRRLGPVPRLDISADAEDELSRLGEAVDRIDDWLAWPRDVQVALLSMCAARLRQVQQLFPELDERSAHLFPKLTGFSRAHQPGFVYGLGRGHEPRNGTWLEDGAVWFNELQERVGVERAPEPRPVSKVVRKAERAEQPEEQSSPLPEDWPLRARLQDKMVLLVGGDFTRDRLDRIEHTFGFKRLDHASGHEPRAIQSFAEAIERGRFDLVIILTRWLNHSASLRIVQACRSGDVRFVQTDGYSTTTLQLAFEHALTPDEG
jgi:hypothetical protein